MLAPHELRVRALVRLVPAVGLAAAWLSGCAVDPAEQTRPDAPPAHGAIATSTDGMVVTGSPYATEAGARMLAAGGNAIDAAVAAAFALAVTEPTQSGLGGRSQLLLQLGDGTVRGIDGTTQVPAGYDATVAPPGETGHAAVGIPGTVAALTRALEEHGSLPLEDVLAPAIGWAEGGFILTEGEADRLEGVLEGADRDGPLAVFLDAAGRPLAAGATLRQPKLAETLRAIASDGPDAFYRGDIAALMAADFAEHGGFVAAADLAAYRAVDAPIGIGRFRGYEVVGSYLPASGVTVIEILQILDRLEPDPEPSAWVAAVAAALTAGFEDREVGVGLSPRDAVAWLTSDSLADRRAATIESGSAAGAPGAPSPEWPFTTHVSAADTLGNLVALTQSLGPNGGARVMTPELGFLYASTMGGYLAATPPGARPWSSQAPLLVSREGGPTYVMGGAGARRIVSALVAVTSRLADGEMPLADAMAAPRLHPTEGVVLLDERWAGTAVVVGAESRLRPSSYFARLNVVARMPDRTFLGVGEPRWAESAAAARPTSSVR